MKTKLRLWALLLGLCCVMPWQCLESKRGVIEDPHWPRTVESGIIGP